MKNFTRSLLITGMSLYAGICTAQWQKVAPIPAGLTDGCMSFTIGDTAYVTGGLSSKDLWAYHAGTNKWRSDGAMGGNKMRPFGFAFALNGKGYIMGGNATAGVCNDMWMYDPATGLWTQKASFTAGMRNAGFYFVLNNIAYVGGGEDETGAIWNDLWKYDPAADKWTAVNALPMGNIMFPACFTANGKAYVTTWMKTTTTSTTEENTMWEFDPAGSGKWTQKAGFPGSPRQCAVAFSMGNYGFVGGGQSSYTTVFTDMWRYDVLNDKWTKAEDLPMTTPAWAVSFIANNNAYVGTGVAFGTSGLIGNDNFYKYTSMTDVAAVRAAGNAFRVFPNPANASISFTAGAANNLPLHITVQDITGRVVKDYGITTAQTFDISELQNGCYFLRLQDKEGSRAQPFIKN